MADPLKWQHDGLLRHLHETFLMDFPGGDARGVGGKVGGGPASAGECNELEASALT